MTPPQLEASAKAPCTSTTVGTALRLGEVDGTADEPQLGQCARGLTGFSMEASPAARDMFV
jgi:hypothetical protein